MLHSTAVIGGQNSVVISGKSNLLSWNKIVLREHDTGGHKWVNPGLNSRVRSRSLPWIMESSCLSENQYCGACFVSREHNFTRDVYADTRKGEPGGRVALCVSVHVYFCMLLCKQFTFMFYSLPIQWYTHRAFSRILQLLPSPRGFHLDFPHLSPMFKCTVIQSPQDSAKKWALLLSNPPCFLCGNSSRNGRLFRSVVL